MARVLDPEFDGGGGGGGSGGYGGRTWIIDPAPDTLTFSSPPANGSAIHVEEYTTAALAATDLWSFGAWNGEYGYPGEVEFHGARLWWAASRAQPQTVWVTRSEGYYNFGISTPASDDDGFTATLNSRTLNTIQDLVPLQNLVLLSSGGAWKETTPQDSPITFSSVTFRTQAAVPASPLPALLVDSSALFCTAKGYQVRDLTYSFEVDGYAGSDLTAFAAHLTQFHAIVDWDFQLVPYSAAWSVREDGVLLCLVYKREHQVAGWTRAATPNGAFRSVVVIPEDDADAVYAIVERTLGGVVVDSVERMAQPSELAVDWMGVDCGLTYDGRNTGATTLTLSGAAYDPDTLLTITASAAVFAESNVGDVVVFGYGTEAFARIGIHEFVSPTEVTAYAFSPVDPAWQAVATTDWALAVDTLGGLEHLEGHTVQVIGDAQQMGDYVVDGGSVSLSEPAVVAHVGFAYDADLESLEVNLPGAETVQGKTKLIRRVDVRVQDGRNVRAGVSFDKLEAHKPRAREPWGLAPDSVTGLVEFNLSATWSTVGKVCIRAGGGLPATVLSLSPHVGIGQ